MGNFIVDVLNVRISNLAGDELLCIEDAIQHAEQHTATTVDDFLLLHETVLGGEQGFPVECLKLVVLDADDAEPLDHTEPFLEQLRLAGKGGVFDCSTTIAGCVPFVTCVLRLALLVDTSACRLEVMDAPPMLTYFGTAGREDFICFSMFFSQWCENFRQGAVTHRPRALKVLEFVLTQFLESFDGEDDNLFKCKFTSGMLLSQVRMHQAVVSVFDNLPQTSINEHAHGLSRLLAKWQDILQTVIKVLHKQGKLAAFQGRLDAELSDEVDVQLQLLGLAANPNAN